MCGDRPKRFKFSQPCMLRLCHLTCLSHHAVPSCKQAHWPGLLPVRGVLSFDFSSKRVRKITQASHEKMDFTLTFHGKHV